MVNEDKKTDIKNLVFALFILVVLFVVLYLIVINSQIKADELQNQTDGVEVLLDENSTVNDTIVADITITENVNETESNVTENEKDINNQVEEEVSAVIENITAE